MSLSKQKKCALSLLSCAMSCCTFCQLVDKMVSLFLQVIVMVIREWLLLRVTASGLSGSPCACSPFCTGLRCLASTVTQSAGWN